MSDSYLWNKSGDRDPYVHALVARLSTRSYARRRRPDLLPVLAPLAAAAAILVASFLLSHARPPSARADVPARERSPAAGLAGPDGRSACPGAPANHEERGASTPEGGSSAREAARPADAPLPDDGGQR